MNPTNFFNRRAAVGLIGYGLILGSLFVPAVDVARNSAMGIKGVQPGWWCAVGAIIDVMAMLASLLRGTGLRTLDEFVTGVLFAFASLINPMLLALTFGNRLWRHIAAGTIAVSLIATWIAMARASFEPLLGHVMWVGGIAVLLLPTVAEFFYQRHLNVKVKARRGSRLSD